METILSEYLSFSRPLEDLKPESLDLAAVARDVLDVLGGRAEEAGVALELDGSAARAAGDPRRLKEALINLVSNAIEATPTGGKVSLKLRGTPAEITLEVRDTGRGGITNDDLDRLGTSFFTTRPGGTGLGRRPRARRDRATRRSASLSEHRGYRHDRDDHAARSTGHFARAGRARSVRRGAGVTSVLLVDDEPGVLFTIGEVLGDRGHRVISVRSGAEALAKLDEADAVLTDLSMPEIDGLELMAQIGARDPALPVIAC